jgi:hypothetical protein
MCEGKNVHDAIVHDWLFVEAKPHRRGGGGGHFTGGVLGFTILLQGQLQCVVLFLNCK